MKWVDVSVHEMASSLVVPWVAGMVVRKAVVMDDWSVALRVSLLVAD